MTFNNSILAGLTLVRDAIQSEDYQVGVSGWRISRDGDAEFNDITARGNIEASRVSVVDPNEPTSRMVIEPDPVTGNPRMFANLQGTPFLLLQPRPSNGGILDIKSGDGAGEIHTLINTTTSSARIRLGDADSVNNVGRFVNGDYMDVVTRWPGGVRRHQIQTFESEFPFGELELQPDGGEVTYNGRALTVRAGASQRTSSIGPFTNTETECDSVTVNVRQGRTYRVTYQLHFESTVSNDRCSSRIRLNNVSGTTLSFAALRVGGTNTTECLYHEGAFVPGASGNITVVGTGIRANGTGNVTATASGATVARLSVYEEN